MTTATRERTGPPVPKRKVSRTWRHLLVFLHVASSVSWMSQAAALAVLLGVAASPGAWPGRLAAVEAATILDDTVLVHSADVSAATGFLLAAVTSWGFAHFGWVFAKFAITIGQLYLGIFVLSARLDGAADTIRAGSTDGVPFLAVSAALMASAFAVQVWLSVAKPGGRTRWGRRRAKLDTAPTWMFVVSTLTPIADVLVGIHLGHPQPVLSLSALLVFLFLRGGAREQPGPRGQAASRG